MKKFLMTILFATTFFSLTSAALAIPYTFGDGGPNVGSFDDAVVAVYNSNSGNATEIETFNNFPGSPYSLTQDKVLWKDANFVHDDGTNDWVQVYDGGSWVPSYWAYEFDFAGNYPDYYLIKLGGNGNSNTFYYDLNGNEAIEDDERFAINTVVYENLASKKYAVVDLSRFLWVKTNGSEAWLTGADHNEKISHISAPIPEPSTILLLGSGLVGLAWYGRKRKKA